MSKINWDNIGDTMVQVRTTHINQREKRYKVEVFWEPDDTRGEPKLVFETYNCQSHDKAAEIGLIHAGRALGTEYLV